MGLRTPTRSARVKSVVDRANGQSRISRLAALARFYLRFQGFLGSPNDDDQPVAQHRLRL